MLRESLSHGWLFSRGGDDGFESVIIPHDGMLGAPRSAGAPSGSAQGYFEGGTYTYRRAICAKRRGGCVLLEFEGVYRDAVVRLDGRTVASLGTGTHRLWSTSPESSPTGHPTLSGSPALMPSSLIRTGIRGQASIAPRGFGRGRATATLHLGM